VKQTTLGELRSGAAIESQPTAEMRTELEAKGLKTLCVPTPRACVRACLLRGAASRRHVYRRARERTR